VLEDDLIARSIRRLAAALAGTSAAEVRAEGEIEVAKADAALGGARDRLGRGDPHGALAMIDEALGALTNLAPETALRLDARTLVALAPHGGRARLVALLRVRAEALDACGEPEEASRARTLAEAIANA
jgi:hypothetical protein